MSKLIRKGIMIPELVLIAQTIISHSTSPLGGSLPKLDYEITSDLVTSIVHLICDIANRLPDTAIDLLDSNVKKGFRSIMLWIHS
eukprot:23084_4